MGSALSADRVAATPTAWRAESAAMSGVSPAWEAKAPGSVDDHPDRQADVAVEYRRLQFAVAQMDDLGGQGVYAQVGVAGAAGGGRRQRGVGQPVQRQRKKVVVNATVAGPVFHGSTVAGDNRGHGGGNRAGTGVTRTVQTATGPGRS